MGEWNFFSNHGHVLVCLARDREARLRDVAIQVGITERAVQKIVRDMQDEGYLEISKHGRRNRYRINTRKALRHPLQSGCTVGQLIQLLAKPESNKSKPKEPVKTVAPATPEPEPIVEQQVQPPKKPPVESPVRPSPETPVEAPREIEPEPGHSETVEVEPEKTEAAPSEPQKPETEPEDKDKKPAKADLEQGSLF